MTREEQVRVGTETFEAGRARLCKYVVIENVTTTVPVSREEVRVVCEPITTANRGDALDGQALSEDDYEVTLQEERPVLFRTPAPDAKPTRAATGCALGPIPRVGSQRPSTALAAHVWKSRTSPSSWGPPRSRASPTSKLVQCS